MKARGARGRSAETIRIGALAVRTSVAVSTLRFYERRGLLPPPARDQRNNFRAYPEGAVEWVAAIRRAQHVGFTLREIRGLLELRGARRPHADLVRRSEAKLVEVKAELARLADARVQLERLIADCRRHRDAADCDLARHLLGTPLGARRRR